MAAWMLTPHNAVHYAGLVYCMNYIDHNFDWLEEKLQELEGKYILFDFPGQVELYTHEASVFNILQKLQKLNYKVRAGSSYLSAGLWRLVKLTCVCNAFAVVGRAPRRRASLHR